MRADNTYGETNFNPDINPREWPVWEAQKTEDVAIQRIDQQIYPEHSIRTFSGTMVDLKNLDPKTIKVEDIAWGLATEYRYGGHTVPSLITVAQHSVEVAVRVAKGAPVEYQLAALMHDASEAYIRDMPRPIKSLLPDYQKLERYVMEKVCERFEIDWNVMDSETIKKADMDEFWCEQQYFQGNYFREHKYEKPWTIDQSFNRFIQVYNELILKINGL